MMRLPSNLIPSAILAVLLVCPGSTRSVGSFQEARQEHCHMEAWDMSVMNWSECGDRIVNSDIIADGLIVSRILKLYLLIAGGQNLLKRACCIPVYAMTV